MADASNTVDRAEVHFLYYKSRVALIGATLKSLVQHVETVKITVCENNNSDPTRRKLWKQTLTVERG